MQREFVKRLIKELTSKCQENVNKEEILDLVEDILTCLEEEDSDKTN